MSNVDYSSSIHRYSQQNLRYDGVIRSKEKREFPFKRLSFEKANIPFTQGKFGKIGTIYK